MKVRIPEAFLEIARIEGVGEEFAGDFFIRKHAKKSIDDIVFGLVQKRIFNTEKDARNALLRVWKGYNRKKILDSSNPNPVPKSVVRTYESYVEAAHVALEKMIGTLPKVTVPKKSKSSFTKTVLVGDFHFPFVSPSCWDALMKEEADVAVIAGDWFDMYAASKYRLTTDHITATEELAIGTVALRQLASRFSEVKILLGNHDMRATRRLQEMAPQLLPLIVNPMDLISRGIPNVEVVKTIVPNTKPLTQMGEDIELEFVAQYKDCVFGHFEGFCGPDAPRRAEKWLNEWSHILKFENPPKVITQSHIHRLQMEYTAQGRLLIGAGCMCLPMPYQFDNHGKYSPPTQGYVVLEHDQNGVTDLKRTKLVPLM